MTPVLWPDLSIFETHIPTATALHFIENRPLGSMPKVIGNVDQGHETGKRNILGLFVAKSSGFGERAPRQTLVGQGPQAEICDSTHRKGTPGRGMAVCKAGIGGW